MLLLASAFSLWAPKKYTMRGSLRLPLANVTEPFEAAFDLDNNNAFVGYFDNVSFTIWNGAVWHVFYQADHQNCTHTINGQNDTEASITTMLPDLASDRWELRGETTVRGVVCNHYVLPGFDGVPTEDGTYNWNVTDFQEYFCIKGADFNNEPYCIPFRWDIHGYNTNGGSHYDFYRVDYDEFDPLPNFSEDSFKKPEVCKDVKISRPIAGNDLFLRAAAQSETTHRQLRMMADAGKNFTFRMAPNRFLGTKFDDFKALYTGYNHASRTAAKQYVPKGIETPSELDLRVKAVVTPVKDQAVCGSCWTFGTAGVLEGRINYRRRHLQEPLVRVSEQQILSCTWLEVISPEGKNVGNIGCNGGETNLALDQVVALKGGRVPLESLQPYLGMEGACDDSAWTSKYGRVKASVSVSPELSFEERKAALKEALMEGPVGVSIAVSESMSFYAGGVFNDQQCGKGSEANLLHAVLAVGWGTDAELGDYWIIKNSWSNAWGMDGYIYISMDEDLCGVLQAVTFFEFEEEAPATPDAYHFKGVFSLPYANLSQELEVYYDVPNGQQKMSWYQDADYNIWDLKKNEFYGVMMYLRPGAAASEPLCSLTPPYGIKRDTMIPILPDLTEWTRMPDTKLMGQVVRHYRLNTIDVGGNDPPIYTSGEQEIVQGYFGSTREDQQDYFCVQDAEGRCRPVRWEIHGYNTIFSSHYDYYVLDFDEFEFGGNFDQSLFVHPVGLECKEYIFEAAGRGNLLLQSLRSTAENTARTENMAKINGHESTHFSLAPNRFVDYSFEQFLQMHTGYIPRSKRMGAQEYTHQVPFKHPELDNAGRWYVNETTGVRTQFPTQLDYRVQGGVPPVRDQANCGSCWSFGAASVLEARWNKHFIMQRTKPLFEVSEQAIIDCFWSYEGLHGCSGGTADETFDRIISDFGGKLASRIEYPYLGQTTACRKDLWSKGDLLLESFSVPDRLSVGQLKYALLDGPVTVAIAVTEKMVFYSGGIFDDEECVNDVEKALNHQVVVVGWGADQETGQEYWIVRNSWSNAWGVDGYIYIAINKCGVTLEPAIPNFIVPK